MTETLNTSKILYGILSYYMYTTMTKDMSTGGEVSEVMRLYDIRDFT